MDNVIVEACFENAEQTLDYLNRGDRNIDIILLDINMPGLSGLDLSALLPEPAPQIIFTTAYAEHAVRAFDIGAADYVLKPIDAARLQLALQRSIDRRPNRNRNRNRNERLPRLAISTVQGVILVNPSDISHAILEGELLSIYANGRVLLTDIPLNELQNRLPADGFERASRQAIINLDHVDMLAPTETGGYEAKMKIGKVVQISRSVARRLRRQFGLR